MRIDQAIEGALTGIEAGPTMAKFRQATQGIEQIFVKQLLEQMRKASPSSDRSFGMEMYEDMMNDALAGAVSRRGDFGIGDQLRDAMEPQLVREALAVIRLRRTGSGR